MLTTAYFRSTALGLALSGMLPVAMATESASVTGATGDGSPLSSVPAAVNETPPAASPSDSLSDVVVTARRVRENLQNVPVAVTVLSGEALKEQNVVSIEDLSAKVPSLQTANGSGDRDQVVFSLRGLSQTFGGSAPAVVMYFADVPTFPAGPSLLYDLESLEVLKGPQGTLFGRNTTGGAILVNPQRPVNQLGGYVEVTGGDYGLFRYQAAVNVPVVDDKLMIRLAIDENHREGFTTDLQNGDKLDGIHYRDFRISVLAKPLEGLENYLVYDQDDSNSHGGGLVLSALAPGSLVTEIAPGITNYYAQQQARGIRTVQYDTGADFDIISTKALTDVLTYSINDNLSAKGIYGYRQFVQRYTSDTDASPFGLIQMLPSSQPAGGTFASPTPFTQQTGELQLQGNSFEKKLPWTLGAYYERVVPYSTTEVDNLTIFGNTFLQQALRYDASKAAYGQASYHLDDQVPGLTVTGGLRYTKDTRKLSSSIIENGTCTQINADADCLRTQEANFSALTYTADIDYQITSKTLLYFTTRKGYKSGGFNSSVPADSPAPTSFGPETVRDGEIGIKTDFNLGSSPARVNADYYFTKYKDIQLSHNYIDPISGENISATNNVGAATIQGIELEGSIIPIPGFEVSGFYGYINPRYDTVGFIGDPFFAVPKSKIGLTTKYDIPVGAAGIISPGGSYTYQSLSHVSNTPNAFDVQGGYGTLDARLDWREIFGSKLELSGFVTNVTNKVYAVYEINLYATVGINDSLYGAPRMFGVRAHYSF